MKNRLFFLAPLVLLTVACGNQNTCSQSTSSEPVSSSEPAKDYLTLWNNREALTKLKTFVENATTEGSEGFIPVEDRIATFDMDGTFVGELYPSYFEYNMLEYRVLDDPDYKDIAPADVVECAQTIRDHARGVITSWPAHFDMIHARAAAKAYAGMTLKEFDDYVKAYGAKPANGFSGMTYGGAFYKPMLEVFEYLEDHDFTYYVVSGSDRFICRALVDSIGIAPNRVIGMDVELKSSNQGEEEGVDYTMASSEYLIRTENLLIKNLKTNKVKQIAQEIGKVPVLSFGNSSGDSAMHNYCLGNDKYPSEAFMLIADDAEEDYIDAAETAKRKASWEGKYTIISMHDDFKTVYGENVTKTEFVFE